MTPVLTRAPSPAPEPSPKLPPPLLGLGELFGGLVGAAEVLAEDGFGVGGELVHVEVAIGFDHDLERTADLGRAVVAFDGVACAVERAYVGAAREIVLGDVHLIRSETIAQVDHALTSILGVLAVREALNERLEGLERAERIGGRPLRQVGF